MHHDMAGPPGRSVAPYCVIGGHAKTGSISRPAGHAPWANHRPQLQERTGGLLPPSAIRRNCAGSPRGYGDLQLAQPGFEGGLLMPRRLVNFLRNPSISIQAILLVMSLAVPSIFIPDVLCPMPDSRLLGHRAGDPLPGLRSEEFSQRLQIQWLTHLDSTSSIARSMSSSGYFFTRKYRST